MLDVEEIMPGGLGERYRSQHVVSPYLPRVGNNVEYVVNDWSEDGFRVALREHVRHRGEGALAIATVDGRCMRPKRRRMTSLRTREFYPPVTRIGNKNDVVRLWARTQSKVTYRSALSLARVVSPLEHPAGCVACVAWFPCSHCASSH